MTFNQLLILYQQQGDIDARNQIIEQNDQLIWHFVHKAIAVQPELDQEELHSIGVIAMIKCLDKFDQNSTTKLSTYYTGFWQNELRLFNRERDRNYFPVSAEDIQEDGSYEIGEQIQEFNLVDLVRDKINTLTAEEQEIIIAVMAGRSLEDIGSDIGISRQAVSVRTIAIKKKLREEFELNGITSVEDII